MDALRIMRASFLIYFHLRFLVFYFSYKLSTKNLIKELNLDLLISTNSPSQSVSVHRNIFYGKKIGKKRMFFVHFLSNVVIISQFHPGIT